MTSASHTMLLSLAATLALSLPSLAQVSGTVKLDGPTPAPKAVDMSTNPDCAKLHPDPVDDDTVVADAKGMLQNVIVSIKPKEGEELAPDAEPPKTPVVLDQLACMYIPHVVALMAGQTLVVKNSDNFMHNVHSLPDANPPVNQAQPTKDEEGIKLNDLKSAETFMIKCDVHPWMKAWVGVFDHPYFAVTDDSGKFSFDTKGLKDGNYTLQAWHEKFGTTTQKITIKSGKATATFTVKQEAADATNKATATATKTVTAAGATTEGECKECCSTVTRASLAAKAAK